MPPSDKFADFRRALVALAELQDPLGDVSLRADMPAEALQEAQPRFKAFELLAVPIRKAFKFHFMGDRPTNRLDKVRQKWSTKSI